MNPNRRINEHARTAADQFDATLLANRVYDQVQGGHTTDPQLRRVVELSEGAYELADEREAEHGHDDGVGAHVFDAAETLAGKIDTLVDEEIAQACVVIVRDSAEWTDTWEPDEIGAARTEAMEWLLKHEDVAARIGYDAAQEVLADD